MRKIAVRSMRAAGRGARKSGRAALDRAIRRRRLDRARLASADALRAEAPAGAGYVAVVSFPASLLAFATTGSFGAKGVYLPPAGDARAQLWCVAMGVIGIVVAVDCWYGFGSCVRAFGDGLTAAIVAVTVALAVTSPLMIFGLVESRPAWLCVLAAQFCWSFAGAILGATVAGRRKRRLGLGPATARPARDAWLAEYGIQADRDLVLVSPGSRRGLVVNAVGTLTGMSPRGAAKLVDNAPGVLMRQVTGERADKARALLESLGATVSVSGGVADVVGQPGAGDGQDRA